MVSEYGHVSINEYEESKHKIEKLLMMNRLEALWKVEPNSSPRLCISVAMVVAQGKPKLTRQWLDRG